MDLIEMTLDIQKHFGIAYDGPPRYLSPEEKKFREECLREEIQEYIDAETLENQFDALLDLQAYVAIALIAHGFPYKEGYQRVCNANIVKTVGPNAKRGNFKTDLTKPEGWIPPDHSDLLYPKGIILLEGPDTGGKTTLANRLAEKYNGWIMHATWDKDKDGEMDFYLNSQLSAAIDLAEHQLVILDRHWMSPLVYSKVYDQKGVSDEGWYEIIKQSFVDLNIPTIICLPDRETFVDHFNNVRAKRSEMFDDSKILQVYDAYEKLWMDGGVNCICYNFKTDSKHIQNCLEHIRRLVQS